MTLQQLQYIVALDHYRQFILAADACGVTQSTMSLMVKKLEEELDVIVFDRSSHPLEPTEAGKKVIAKAKVILFNTRQLKEIALDEKQIHSGILRIAMISTTAPVLMPGLFHFFGVKYPLIELHAEEMLSSTIKDKIRKAEMDIGIVTSPVNDPELLEIPLYHEHFLAYLSEGLLETVGESISRDHLFQLPLWVMSDGVHLAETAHIDVERVRYEHLYEGGRVGTLIQIVNENGGATIVPETHQKLVLNSLKKNLIPIVNPEPERTISLVVRRDFIHEGLLNAVVEAVKVLVPAECLEEMVKNEHIEL